MEGNTTSNFLCEVCGKGFVEYTKLSSHKKSHREVKKFHCQAPGCCKSFSKPSLLIRHTIQVHTDKTNSPYKCLEEGCGKVLSRKSTLRSHLIKIHHKEYDQELYVRKASDTDVNGTRMDIGLDRSESSRTNLQKCKTARKKQTLHDTTSTEGITNLVQQEGSGHLSFETIAKTKKIRIKPSNTYVLEKLKSMYSCTKENCSRTYTTKTALNRHVRAEHDKILPFVCRICDLPFACNSSMKRHLRKHDRNPDTADCKWKCEYSQCGKGFSSRFNLSLHKVKVHQEANPFKCTFGACEKTFLSRQGLSTHIELDHENEKTFACTKEGCEKKFLRAKLLFNHMELHANVERILVCSFKNCGKGFCNKYDLNLHLKWHNLRICNGWRKVFVCPLEQCKNEFCREGGLQNHFKLKHAELCNYKCPLEYCKKVFLRNSDFQQHIERHKTKKDFEERTYRCRFSKCQRYFKHKYLLMTHMKSHKKKANQSLQLHKCNHANCEGVFYSEVMLRLHSRSHEPVKFCKKICPVSRCKNKLVPPEQWKGHIAKHLMSYTSKNKESLKKYQCLIGKCNEYFTSVDHYSLHQLTCHGKEKPFLCSYPDCLVRFKTNVERRQHYHFVHSLGFPLCKVRESNITKLIDDKLECAMEKQSNEKMEVSDGECTETDQKVVPTVVCKVVNRDIVDDAFIYCRVNECKLAFMSMTALLLHVQISHPNEYKITRELYYK